MPHLVHRRELEADRWQYERRFWDAGMSHVAGVDEVGRGPLAGPVVAVACILPADFDDTGVRDSKLLAPHQRLALYPRISQSALGWGVGVVGPEDIDRHNILGATFLAMQQALEQLPFQPDAVLVDGKFLIPDVAFPQRAVIDGDRLCVSVGCASILAKEIRDRIMEEFDVAFPGYGFARHKGYATAEHLEMLRQLGPSPIHRRSFAPVREWRQEELGL